MTSLRLSPSVTAGRTEIVVVERVSVHGDHRARAVTVVPVAVVMRSRADVWASDLDGASISLTPLLDQVAGLRAWVGEPA